jgi:hypothetical protein
MYVSYSRHAWHWPTVYAACEHRVTNCAGHCDHIDHIRVPSDAAVPASQSTHWYGAVGPLSFCPDGHATSGVQEVEEML